MLCYLLTYLRVVAGTILSRGRSRRTLPGFDRRRVEQPAHLSEGRVLFQHDGRWRCYGKGSHPNCRASSRHNAERELAAHACAGVSLPRSLFRRRNATALLRGKRVAPVIRASTTASACQKLGATPANARQAGPDRTARWRSRRAPAPLVTRAWSESEARKRADAQLTVMGTIARCASHRRLRLWSRSLNLDRSCLRNLGCSRFQTLGRSTEKSRRYWIAPWWCSPSPPGAIRSGKYSQIGTRNICRQRNPDWWRLPVCTAASPIRNASVSSGSRRSCCVPYTKTTTTSAIVPGCDMSLLLNGAAWMLARPCPTKLQLRPSPAPRRNWTDASEKSRKFSACVIESYSNSSQRSAVNTMRPRLASMIWDPHVECPTRTKDWCPLTNSSVHLKTTRAKLFEFHVILLETPAAGYELLW